MKVLLYEDIPKLGYLGDVVEIADGYARNYLLPQKLAVVPTEDNIKAIQKERAQQVEVRRLAREQLLSLAQRINDAQVNIQALANQQGHLFGSVSQQDIAHALQEKGFEVQTKHLLMTEHFRQLGDYDVKLRFAEDIDANVQVQITQPPEQDDDQQPESDQLEQ